MNSRSLADPIAIQQTCFDEEKQAMRVVIVSGEVPVFQLQESTQKIVETQSVVKETEIKIVEVPVTVIQKEIQIERIEVPVYLQQIVEVTKEVLVQVPGPTKIEIQTVEIEKPVYITQTEYKDLPKWLIVFLGVQTISTLILAFLKFLK
jgi:hypothetical protein